MKSNSITIRKRILAASKVGSGLGRACALYDVRALPTHPQVSIWVNIDMGTHKGKDLLKAQTAGDGNLRAQRGRDGI